MINACNEDPKFLELDDWGETSQSQSQPPAKTRDLDCGQGQSKSQNSIRMERVIEVFIATFPPFSL